jgi:hypothetical protein
MVLSATVIWDKQLVLVCLISQPWSMNLHGRELRAIKPRWPQRKWKETKRHEVNCEDLMTFLGKKLSQQVPNLRDPGEQHYHGQKPPGQKGKAILKGRQES